MREILVFGEKTFKIRVPDDARITFGPWSPGEKSEYRGAAKGTLRVYHGTGEKNCIAVFSGVTAYREATLDYSEMVVREEGAAVWKNDATGYYREEKGTRTEEWKPELSAKTKKRG